MKELLPLFALGLGAYFLSKKKPASTNSSSVQNDSKIGSKDIGYEIINCSTVKIYNEQKAFQYAFTIGSQQGLNQNANVESYLLGDCFEQLEDWEKEKAIAFIKNFYKSKVTLRFIYNLFRFAYSGYALTSQDKETAQNQLNDMKEKFKSFGFDTNDLQSSLVIEMPKI